MTSKILGFFERVEIDPQPGHIRPTRVGEASAHRVSEQLVKNRTALANQIRGLLGEREVVVAKAIARLRARALPCRRSCRTRPIV